MKNTVKILCLLAGALVLLGACKEEGLLVYDNENNIYFQHKKFESSSFSATLKYDDVTYSISTTSGSTALDSLSVSMAQVNTIYTSVITFLPLKVMGRLADHERKVAWRVINTDIENAGVEGEDFRVLDAFVPANSRIGGIVIEMFRQNLGGDKFFYADFELLPNDNFQTNFVESTRTSSSEVVVSPITMRLKFTDGLTKPTYWDAFLNPYFGDWSTKKAYILNENIGVPFEYMYGTSMNDVTSSTYAFAFKRWLDDYRIENGEPIYEVDGVTVMTAGAKIE